MLALTFISLGRFHFRHVFERLINIHLLFPHAVLDDFTAWPGHEEHWTHRGYVEENIAAKSTGQKVPGMSESTTKKIDELLFSFINFVSGNLGKIRALATWSRRYDLLNISRANLEKIPPLLQYTVHRWLSWLSIGLSCVRFEFDSNRTIIQGLKIIE